MIARFVCFSLLAANPAFATEAPSLPCKGVAVLKTGDENVEIPIEIAANDAERAQGLMFREDLDGGMLFLYPEAKFTAFWMKDTLIPLDMLFFNAIGRVETIYENAKPLDTTPIFGGNEILAVLELKGGAAEEFGFQSRVTELRYSSEGECPSWISELALSQDLK